MTLDEARHLVIEGINYATYHETDFSLYDQEREKREAQETVPLDFDDEWNTSNDEITFEGGNGDIVERAVVIQGVRYDLVGTYAEFQWLAEHFGQKDVAWKLVSHTHGIVESRHIDTVVIRLLSGERVTKYFDVTESFGKT